MKPNIVFDIDGVVANFAAAFKMYAPKRYGIKIIDIPEFNWDFDPPLTGLMIENMIARFIRDHSNKIRLMVPGGNLVDYVWNKTHRPITFITARHEMTCSATHHWIKTYFPYIDPIIITVNTGNDKLKYMEDYACIAEDRRKTAIHLASNGKIIFLPIRDYNWPMPDDLDHYTMAGIIPFESLRDATNGQYDHLLFKK